MEMVRVTIVLWGGFFDRYYYNKILKILIKARDNRGRDEDA